MSQIVRDTGLAAADTWALADDRSTRRALRPTAGYAQQWVSEWLSICHTMTHSYLFLQNYKDRTLGSLPNSGDLKCATSTRPQLSHPLSFIAFTVNIYHINVLRGVLCSDYQQRFVRHFMWRFVYHNIVLYWTVYTGCSEKKVYP